MAKAREPNIRPIVVQLRIDLMIDTSQNLWPQIERLMGEKLPVELRPRDFSVISE